MRWGQINIRTWRPHITKLGPKVLLTHGYCDSAGCFTKLVKKLPSDWNVAGFDFPGHGDSTFPKSTIPQADLNLHSISHVVNHLGWDQFHLVGHSMGGNASSAYNILFPEQLQSLTLLDSDGSFIITPEYQRIVMKMSILIDRDQSDMFYKRGRARTWKEWRTLVKNSKTDQAGTKGLTQWFPTDAVADEWLTHTLKKVDSNLWLPKTHPRIKFPFPSTTISLSAETLLTGAKMVNTVIFCIEGSVITNKIIQPLLRIDGDKKVRWNKNRIDDDQNKEFFKLLKSNSVFAKHAQIPGTHMLHLTNPLGVSKELIDFIPKAETKI